MPILSEVILFLDLKVVVGAVVVEDAFLTIHHLLRVLIQFRLKGIVLLRKDLQRPVNLVEFTGRLFKEHLR